MSEYLPAHFHFSGEWIQAEIGRNAGRAVSAYMQRTSAGLKVSEYLQRSREVDDELTRESEVAHYFLFSNGLDVNAKALWAMNDRVNRNRHGEYKLMLANFRSSGSSSRRRFRTVCRRRMQSRRLKGSRRR